MNPRASTTSTSTARATLRRPGTSRRPLAAGIAALAALALGSSAHATTYYWTGNSAGNAANNALNPAFWTSSIGGTNWSTLPTTLSDPGTDPGSLDDVFFGFNPEQDVNTVLGQDFSIHSLNFNGAATSPVTIGGANTLTIGLGGLTALAGSASVSIGANVAIGGVETWTDNAAVSSETIGGTFHAGDIVSTVVDGITVNYTVQATDTNQSGVAIGIANAINSNASLVGLVNATTNGATVSVSGYQGVAALSSSVSGTGATTTATAVNGSAITVSGLLSGSSGLTLEGTGSTQTPSGTFIFSGSGSTYSGAFTLLNANTSVTVNGGGTLASAAGVTLGGGTVFTLDDTGTNVTNRLSSSIPVSSNGGAINLLGNSSAASADQIGALTLNTGGTNINVTPGSGQTATLTIGSVTRTPGAGVNFSSTGTIDLTNSSLNNGILGPWATIGSLTNNGASLDFATVSAGKVVAYSGYDTTVTDLTTAGTGHATSNIKLTSGTAVLAGSSTINTLYMSGTSGIEINAAGASSNTLTIGAGGIIANGGTSSYSLGNGQAEITNATWIGGPAFSGGTTANTDTENQGGVITVPAGVPDLTVTVGGTYNPVTGLINGALQLNVLKITDTVTALGSMTATTTANSTTVTLTSGTTAGLYPGVQVTGLPGNFGSATIEYVVSVIDATHFIIGTAPTTSGAAATATFTGHTGLTKDGLGLLDIADGNANNKTVSYGYEGDVTVNGGVLLVGNDANLGVIPANTGFNPAAITLNGGELRSTAGLTFSADRGITVGPQGGTISYVGGSTLTLSQKITGPGGLTYDADSYNGAVTFNIDNTVQDTYQGPSIIEVKNGSTMVIEQANPLPSGTALTLSIAPNFQSGTNGATTPVTGFGALNLTAAGGMTIGSLASAASVNGANLTGSNATTLTIGGTVASPVSQSATFNGILAGAMSVVKNGGGNQTFAGLNTYTGTTIINAGAIVAANGLGSNANASATGKGAVTVNSGGTLGSASGLDGFITGLVTVNSGGLLAPTVVGSGATTLELNGGLTLSSGSILSFNLGAINTGTNPIAAPTSDNIFVTGALSMTNSGTDTINLNSVGAGLTAGTYHLITATSVPASISGITFTVGGPLQFLYSVVDDTANESLDLVVTTNPNPSLTWVGAPGNGTWNTVGTNTPWTFTGGSGSAAYADGANLTFDNTPGGAAAISIPANVAPGSLLFNNNGLVNYTFSGAGSITGALGFTKENTGMVTFNNVNTFTGAANLQAGSVVVGTNGTLANASFVVSAGANLTVNGALTTPGTTINTAGSVVFNSFSQTLGSLTDTAGAATGVVTLNGTALTLTGASAYDGTIVGAGSLNITSGTTTLSNGGSTYSGGTNVSGVGSTLIVTNATGSATGLAGGGVVAIGSGAILSGTGVIASPVTLDGTLSPAGPGTVGTITLGNVLSPGGAVLAYDFGAPGAGNSDTAAVNGTVSFSGATATLDINALAGFSVGTYTLFTATGAVTDTVGTWNFVPTGASPILTYLVQASGNTLQLVVGATSTTWTGAAGSGGSAVWDMVTANWSPSPTGVYTDPQFVVFDDTGTNTNITVTAGGVNPSGMTFNNTQTYTIGGGPIGGTGSLIKNDSGLVILTGANTYSGGTVINGGTLQIGNGTVNGTIGTGTYSIANGATLALDYATAAAPAWANISGAGTLNLEATTAAGDWGTPALPAGFTGTLEISNGHVAVDAAGAALGGATAIVVGAGASPGTGGQIDLSLGGTFARPFTIAGSGYGVAGQESALRLGGAGLTTTITGPVTLSASATIGAAGTGVVSSAISGASGANLTIGTSGENGTVVLSGPNTYAGATTVAFGTLQFPAPGNLYSANSANWTAANITVDSGATLDVNVGGPSDFTVAQASTLLTNLSTVNGNGLLAGSTLKLDTSNATAPVTFSTAIANSTGTGGGSVGISKGGLGVLNLTAAANNYSGLTSVSNGELILNGTNTGTGTVSAVNTSPLDTTVLSIRNSNALGAGTANSSLAPITLNATGTDLSASILEIGTKIGTDPGGNNADFSYQVVAPGNPNGGTAAPTNVVAGNGQINLGYLGNNDDGTGFAGYNAAFTGSNVVPPRIVALYTPTPGSTTLAILEEKAQFGQGGGDHLTLGSPTANTTVVILNEIDLDGGTSRRWASIRGVGITPEGEYLGAIINSNPTNDNFNFDGNGGLIFANAASTYVSANLQINGGAVFVAASDPAANGQTGALGEGTAYMQIGTSSAVNPAGGEVATTAGAHLGFMTYGPNAGVGPAPTEITNRNIEVGGSGVVYNSVVLGGVTDDYSAMNGTIELNEAPTTPTTFTARNGGRVDFGGNISGVGSVLIGNSIVEGDATTAGIALNNNGTIVFNGTETYTGSTTVSAGKLYINGSTVAASAVSVASGATLGGMGTVNGAVTVADGGILEAGQAGVGALTVNGGLTFNGAAAIDFNALRAVGSPGLIIGGANTLNLNGNTVSLEILGSIAGVGNYALVNYAGVQTTTFSLSLPLPNRAVGILAVNGNELDLDVSSLASIVWTGATNSSWDTTTTNWVVQGGGSTQYIDNPGDSVIFDDTAAPHTVVSINGADVHPSAVNFNNNTSTYTISGTNAIAGSTGLNVNGTGPVILTNANTFTGPTLIATGGTLQLGNGTAGQDGSIATTSGITDNGSLIYKLAGSQTYVGIIGGSGSLAVQGTGTLVLTNANTYGGGTTITGGTLQLGNGTVDNDGSVTGGITNNGALVFNYFGTPTYAASISGTGSVTKSGPGTLTLSGANSYQGATTVSTGTLIVSGSLSGTSSTTVASGASLFLTGAGSVAGPVTNHGTITGTGTFTGAVSSVGGTVVAGASPTSAGTLTVGSLNLDSASTLTLALGGTNPGQSSQVVADGINLASDSGAGATLTLALTNGYTPAINDFLVIGLNSGSESGVFSNTTPASNANFFGGATFASITVGTTEFAVLYNATATAPSGGEDIALLAVPEPGSFGLFAASLGLALGLQRFRRRPLSRI